MFKAFALFVLIAALAPLRASAKTITVNWAVTGAELPPVAAAPGDVVVFSFSGSHTVCQATQAAYAACTVTAFTGCTAAAPYSFTVPSVSGNIYFACDVGKHCANGQKVTVQVSSTTPSPSPPPPSTATTPSPSPPPPSTAGTCWPTGTSCTASTKASCCNGNCKQGKCT